MKTLRKTAMAGLGVLLLGGSAIAGTRTHDYSKTPMQPAPDICGPWFSGINGGVWWVQDYAVSVPYSPLAGDHTVSFDTGFQINVTPIGYRISDMLAVSLEFGFYQADVNDITVPGGVVFAASDGQLRLFPGMVNVSLNVPVATHVNLYAGVGAGVLYRELEIAVPGVAPLATFHDSGWNATAQARAGVAFEVGHCSFINVGYRFNHVWANPDDINGHSVEVGYTFTW